MELNKKAILFTFMSVMVAGLLSAIYSTHQITPIDEDVNTEKARVSSMNQQVITIMAYLKDSIKIIGYTAFDGMIQDINSGSPVYFTDETDIKNSFKSCVLTGSYGVGSTKTGSCTGMTKTINDLKDDISNSLKNDFGIENTITINDIGVNQKGAFTMGLFLDATIKLNKYNIQWDTTETIEADMSIEGLEDPLYFSIESNAYDNTFKRTNFLPKFTTDNFTDFVSNGEYIASNHNVSVPNLKNFTPMSFFGRLANDAEVGFDEEFGILSIVDPNKLTSPPTMKSYVDFMYDKVFDRANCIGILKKVKNTADQRPIVDIAHLYIDFGFGSADIDDLTCA